MKRGERSWEFVELMVNKMLIVGIGQAGKSIAELFRPHSKNYKILIFDDGDGLDSKESVEAYDEHPIKISSRGLKSHDKGLLFVCGSGKVAGVTLRVLEALQAHQMTVVYIEPDLEFASKDERLRHRVHFGVLQEFTRSGKIKEMIMLSNKILLDLTGAGPIKEYYKKVNYYIYSLFQNLNYCDNVDQDFGKFHTPKEISRISTIGWSLLSGDDKIFYNLENITESQYYFNIDQEDLDNDEEVVPNCHQVVRTNKDLGRETSFAIWSNSEPDNHYYVKHYTHYTQEVQWIN